MDTPTALDVRTWTTDGTGAPTFDWTRYGFPTPAEGAPDALDDLVARARSYVEAVTGRVLDASLPANLEPLARDAVTMRTQQIIVSRSRTKDVAERIRQADVQTLRVGDFSVTRISGNLNRGGVRALQVNPWEELSDVLLQLATPEKRAMLLAELSGISPPVGATVQTEDYGLGSPTMTGDGYYPGYGWGASGVYGYW